MIEEPYKPTQTMKNERYQSVEQVYKKVGQIWLNLQCQSSLNSNLGSFLSIDAKKSYAIEPPKSTSSYASIHHKSTKDKVLSKVVKNQNIKVVGRQKSQKPTKTMGGRKKSYNYIHKPGSRIGQGSRGSTKNSENGTKS